MCKLQVLSKKPLIKSALKTGRKTMEKLYCTECGAENEPGSTFCSKCGKPFNSDDIKEEKETSRTVEVIVGILGGIFGLLGGIFAVLFGVFASEVAGLGVSAILASIVGIAGAAYVLKSPKWGGIILIISAVWLLISISLFGIPGAVLLGLAGLLALLRK